MLHILLFSSLSLPFSNHFSVIIYSLQVEHSFLFFQHDSFFANFSIISLMLTNREHFFLSEFKCCVACFYLFFIL